MVSPLALSPAAITILTDNGDSDEIRSTLDPESKITLGNLSPVRLSPNPFFGINLDQMGLDGDTISMEWTNYNPSAFGNQASPPNHSGGYSSLHQINQQPQHSHQQQQPQHLPNILCLSSGDSSSNHQFQHSHSQTQLLSDVVVGNGSLSNGCDITFINVDQLNMDQLKTECILSEDQQCQSNNLHSSQQQFHHLATQNQMGHHSELRLANNTTNDLNDELDVANDEYQTIRIDDSQHQNLHSQHSNAFQYNHQCPSMLDFNPFGWITDRQITPPPSLAASVVEQHQQQPQHSGGLSSSGRCDTDEKANIISHQY